jgi:hypothetical protein
VTSASTSVTTFEAPKKSGRALVAVVGAGVLLAGGAWALVARTNLAAQETSAEPPAAESPKLGAAGPADRAPAGPFPSVEPAPLASTIAIPGTAEPAPSASTAPPAITSGRALPVRRIPRTNAARPSQGSESSTRGKSPDEYR